ncbi:MAG: hypothetical protein ACRDSK_11915 [Actinophytocola sp.]|uniref:hypothetical protein n=1 Tax=Actinophytocola sp. TaxID=1872138 RepID=UPI003D6A6926
MTPQGQDDRRPRAADRGGPVIQAFALAGWRIGAAAGTVLMMFVAVLIATSDPVASLAGLLIALIPIGAGLGAGAGLMAQSAARQRPLGSSATERRTARLASAQAAILEHELRPLGRWARFYDACARSVATYHEVVATVPNGPGRDWLADIGLTLDAELVEALRLARLGESLEPTEGTAPGETVYQVLNRLRTAKESFAETTERAAAIALDLREDSNFVQVRAQLDMLAAQAPRLRSGGV